MLFFALLSYFEQSTFCIVKLCQLNDFSFTNYEIELVLMMYLLCEFSGKNYEEEIMLSKYLREPAFLLG